MEIFALSISSFREDSLSNDNNNSSSRDEDGVAVVPEGRRLRRCRTAQSSNGVMATTSSASSSSASTTSTSSKTSTTRTKCRIQLGDSSVQTDPVILQQALSCSGGNAGVLCPEVHCQRKFKHEAALRNHRFRAHKATDSTAMSAFATASAAAAALAARSIVDDSGGSPSTAQSKGPSLLLPAKQRSFDDEENISSASGGKVIKETEDSARHCAEKDAESLEADCLLIKSTSGMDDNKLDCFVPSHCLQSTPIVGSGSVQLSCAKLQMSTEMEQGAADATLNSSNCPASESTVRDSGECTMVCADKQKMRCGAKKKSKGKSDRIQKNSETVVSSEGLASQTFSQSLTPGCAAAAAEHPTAGALLLQGSEDKQGAKRLKTNGGIPLSMLSVSLNRIPMENDSPLALKTGLATETRNDILQDAEKTGSSLITGVDSTVRGLGLDVAKLCIVSGLGNCAGRDPPAAVATSQSLLAMREGLVRCPTEKTQANNCHAVFAVKAGNKHVQEIAKPILESCLAPPGKGQIGSDSQARSDRVLTPSLLLFRSSKVGHDKILAPSLVHDGSQKQTCLHSGGSLMFAANSSKSLLDHVGKESMPGSHLAYMERTKPESTNSAKGIQNSTFYVRTSTVENIGNPAIKQKCPSYSNPNQSIGDRGTTISAAAPLGGTALIGSGPTLYAKDMLCDLNSFTNAQKDFSSLKGVIPSRNTIPFSVPPGSRSTVPNGNLTWTTTPFISSISSLQHTAGSSTSSDPQTSRSSTCVTALASSMSSSLTPDCSFVPFCRTIQGAPAATSLSKQVDKFCAPSPPLASCPLEANTASEVFVRCDDGSWTSATVGKSVQHAMISNSSSSERNVLVCGGVSLPVPLQPPSSSSSSSSSSSTDLHHGVIPYQPKKEKLLSTLNTSAVKPQSSSSSRSLLTGHTVVQAACPK